MKVFIYVLKHPVTEEVRYVGLTRDPARRLHNEINYPHTKHLKNWVNSLKAESLKPSMEIVEETEEGLACAVERKWIADMKARGCRLINFTDGGERGYTCSPEYRAALSAAMRGKKKKPLSDERKAKISAQHKGTKKPWVSARLREFNKSRRGIPLSDDRKKQMSEIGKGFVTGQWRENLVRANRCREYASNFTRQRQAEIKFLVQEGYSGKVLAESYGLPLSGACAIRQGRMWAKVIPVAPTVLPSPKTIAVFRNEKGQYKRVA